MHEVVTLQLGAQANYLGSHFWNTQEAYFTYGGQTESPVDHDVHFRPGIGADGADTYTPRTVIYDFKAQWGSLRKLNELYDVGQDHDVDRSIWGGATVSRRNPPIQPSEYQQALNAGTEPPRLHADHVRYWSDYSRVFYSPKSAVQIYESELNPGQRSFGDWRSGEDLFDSLSRNDDLFDRDLRPFVEECDQMQGLQVFTSADDAWSSFTVRYLDRLRDELGKLPIWVWASSGRPRTDPTTIMRRATNEARAVFEITQLASKYIPMTQQPLKMPNLLSWNASSPWYTAGLQAAALETATLPWRLRRLPLSSADEVTSIGQATADLDAEGNHNILELSFEADALEAERPVNGDTHPTQEHDKRIRYSVFSAEVAAEEVVLAADPHDFAEMTVSRSARDDDDEAPEDEHDRHGSAGDSRIKRFKTRVEFPILSSFPPLYGHGNTNPSLPTKQVAVRSTLAATSRIAAWARALDGRTRRHLPVDEREAVSDGLRGIADAYSREGLDEDEDWD